MTTPGGDHPARHEHRPDAEHEHRTDVGQQQDEREVEGDEPLGTEAMPQVLLVDGAEVGDVAALAHVGLRDPDPREVLLQVRVDRADRLACVAVRDRRPLPVQPRRPDQRREDGGGRQRELGREDHEEHEDADRGHGGDHRGDESGLDELRQRLDVGGHARHDPAVELTVVVVERHALEVGEDLDAQAVERALGGTARDPGVGPGHEPVETHRDEEDRARDPDDRDVVGLHPRVEATSHQQRPEQREPAVERHQGEAEQQPVPPGADVLEDAERPRRLGGDRVDVDLGRVVRGWQRVELGEQLRGRRERHPHRTTTAPAPAARWSEARGGRHGRRGHGHLDLRLAPRARRDLVRRRGVDLVGDGGRLLEGRVERVGVVGQLRTREERPVALVAGQELLVRAEVGDAAVFDERDASRQAQRRTPVGDEDGRAPGHELAQRRVDRLLGRGVDGRRRVVEQEHPRVAEDGAGEGDALALAAREREAALADDRGEAVGQRLDEPGRSGRFRGGPHRRVGGVGRAVGDVRVHGVGEQEGVLEHDPDLAAERVEGRGPHVDAVDRHPSGGDVVEAGEQSGHRRLAGAARADERDHLARARRGDRSRRAPARCGCSRTARARSGRRRGPPADPRRRAPRPRACSRRGCRGCAHHPRAPAGRSRTGRRTSGPAPRAGRGRWRTPGRCRARSRR